MEALPKKFFEENPLIKRSPAAIVYFRIQSGADDKILANLDQFTRDPEFAPRMEAIRREQAAIEALDSGEALVSMLRRPFDPMNLTALCRKAVSMGDEAFDAILRRYRTSLQDSFLEAACYILAKADSRYTGKLLEQYGDIRNPYARSLAGLLFGLHHLEESQPLLLREYEKLLNDPREPALAQGPLLGIYILHDQA